MWGVWQWGSGKRLGWGGVGWGGVMKKIENAGKLEKRSWCDFRLKLTSKKRRKISGKLAIWHQPDTLPFSFETDTSFLLVFFHYYCSFSLLLQLLPLLILPTHITGFLFALYKDLSLCCTYEHVVCPSVGYFVSCPSIGLRDCRPASRPIRYVSSSDCRIPNYQSLHTFALN